MLNRHIKEFLLSRVGVDWIVTGWPIDCLWRRYQSLTPRERHDVYNWYKWLGIENYNNIHGAYDIPFSRMISWEKNGQLYRASAVREMYDQRNGWDQNIFITVIKDYL